MKLKYYLRGLGIGIIVTAVIMGVTSGSRDKPLSDREIRERAAELGMVEQNGSLAELAQESPETAADSTPDAAAEKTPEFAADALPAATAEKSPDRTPEKTPDASPAATAEKTPEDTPESTPADTETADVVTVEIKSGDSSYTVCQRLEQKGLIASASEFDTYLYRNGYDRKLRTGSYEIPSDAEPEEIAKILCGV